METSERIVAAPVEARTDFVHWTPVVAGALVASALFVVLITFGASLGLSVASSAPTWRDTSPMLTVLSGLFLVLTALVSFGCGGYIAGRLRRTWDPGVHAEFLDFRDGAHGLAAWALAVVISALLAAAIAGAATSKPAPATTPAANTGEALFPYDLDRLFRSDKRDQGNQGNLAYRRGGARRIPLTAGNPPGLHGEEE